MQRGNQNKQRTCLNYKIGKTPNKLNDLSNHYNISKETIRLVEYAKERRPMQFVNTFGGLIAKIASIVS